MKFPLEAIRSPVSSTDWVSRLREMLNAAVEIPLCERSDWLMRNIDDAEERQAVATLLLAYDGEGFLEVDAD